jgi:hypothetical protein
MVLTVRMGTEGTAVETQHLCPASLSRGGLPGLAGVSTRLAGYPSIGVPPAVEKQLRLLTPRRLAAAEALEAFRWADTVSASDTPQQQTAACALSPAMCAGGTSAVKRAGRFSPPSCADASSTVMSAMWLMPICHPPPTRLFSRPRQRPRS